MFEITSVGVGTFEVLGKFMGFEVQKVELVFQVSELASARVCVHVCMYVLITRRVCY